MGDVQPAADGQGWPPAEGWPTVPEGETTGEVRSWDTEYEQEPNPDCEECALRSGKINPPFEQQFVQEGTEEGWASDRSGADTHHSGWTRDEKGWTAEKKTTGLEESGAGTSMPGIIFTNEFGQEITEATEGSGQRSYTEVEGNNSNWYLTGQGDVDESGSEYETSEEWGDAPGQNSGWVSADHELASAEIKRAISDQGVTSSNLNQEACVEGIDSCFLEQSTIAVACFIGHTFIANWDQLAMTESTKPTKATELGHHSPANYVFSAADTHSTKQNESVDDSISNVPESKLCHFANHFVNPFCKSECDPFGSGPDHLAVSEEDPFVAGNESFTNSDKSLFRPSKSEKCQISQKVAKDPFAVPRGAIFGSECSSSEGQASGFSEPFQANVCATEIISDPSASETNHPFASETVQDPFTNETNWDPFAIEKNQYPFVSETNQDPFASETDWDHFAAETNQDPFASEIYKDPFASETNQDPFASETVQDLFANETIWDRFASENQNPFNSEANLDPFASETVQESFNQDSYANKTSQVLTASETNQDPITSNTNWDSFTCEINQDLLASETDQDTFGSETNWDPFVNEVNQNIFPNENNQDAFVSKISLDYFANETNQDPFASDPNQDNFASETNPDPFDSEIIQDTFATETNHYYFVSETNQDLYANATNRVPIIREITQDPLASEGSQGWESTITGQASGEEIDFSTRNRFAQWAVFPPSTADLENFSKDSSQELDDSSGFFLSDGQGDIITGWPGDIGQIQDPFIGCPGQNNIPSPKSPPMEKTASVKEPENSDLSEDEVANRRYGKLYQERDAEKDEVLEFLPILV